MGTYSFTHRKIVQGFSIGGEYSGAAIFVAEYSPDRNVVLWEAGLILDR